MEAGQVAGSENKSTGHGNEEVSESLPLKKRKFQPPPASPSHPQEKDDVPESLPQPGQHQIEAEDPPDEKEDHPTSPQRSKKARIEIGETGDVDDEYKGEVEEKDFDQHAVHSGGWEEQGGLYDNEEDEEGANLLASLEFVISKSDLEARKGRYLHVSSEGEEIAILSHKGSYYAIQNSCPHAGAALCDGDVEDIEDLDKPYSFPLPPLQPVGVTSFCADNNEPVIVCPAHSFRFGLVTGRCTKVLLGALRAEIYQLHIINEFIFIDPRPKTK